MEIIIEILKYVVPVLTAFVGWLLGKKNEADKIKYQERRELKRALYVLLLVRKEVNTGIKLDNLTNVMIKKVNEMFQLNEFDIGPLIQQYLNPIVKEVSITKSQGLFNDYETILKQLSEINPLLTYDLDSKQHINSFLSSWEKLAIEDLLKSDVANPETVLGHFKRKFLIDIKLELDTLIIEVADLIGKKEVKKTRVLLKNEDGVDEDEVEATLKNLFEGTNLV